MGPGFSTIYAVKDIQLSNDLRRPRALLQLKLDRSVEAISDPSNLAYLMVTDKLDPCGYSVRSSRLVIDSKAYKMVVSYVYFGDVNNTASVELSFACNAKNTHKQEVSEAAKWLISSLRNAVAGTKSGSA